MTVKSFTPHPFIRGGHLQTIFGNLSSKPQTLEPEEILSAEIPGLKTEIHLNYPRTSDIRTPIVVLFDNSANEDFSTNQARRTRKILAEGVRTARVNFNQRDNWWRSPKSDSIDLLKKSLGEIYLRYPEAPMWLLGTSTSGTIILNLLGSKTPLSHDIPTIKAAMVVCPIMSPSMCHANISTMSSRLLNKISGGRFSSHLKFTKPPSVPQSDAGEPLSLLGANFQPAQNIRIHTTVLATVDDPLNDIKTILKTPFSDFVSLRIEKSGGHAGFISGKQQGVLDGFWLDQCIVDWVLASHRRLGDPGLSIDNPEPTLKTS